MRQLLLITFFVLLAVAPVAMAQDWEVGVGGGGSFYTSQTVTNPLGSAEAKLANGFIVSAWLDNRISKVFGGELRYDYEQSDLRLSSGSTSVGFGSHTNAIHYDFLLNMASREAKVTPFLAGGAGVKLYTGTGTESAFQPLSNIALLTKTSHLLPLVSVGGGIKFRVSNSVLVRLEVHDYLTPFPSDVIAPAFRSKVGGWISDFVAMGGISYTF